MACIVIFYHFFSCPGIVKEKGIDNVTVDDLIDEVTPKARGKIFYMTIYSFHFIRLHNYIASDNFWCLNFEEMTKCVNFGLARKNMS